MHSHSFAALVRQVPQHRFSTIVSYDNTGLKHLTLIRINSGREQANSPNWARRPSTTMNSLGIHFWIAEDGLFVHPYIQHQEF